MAEKYIWKGPPTAVEIFNEKEPVFVGFLMPETLIPTTIEETNPLFVSWLAFKLIEKEPPPRETDAMVKIVKENVDG